MESDDRAWEQFMEAAERLMEQAIEVMEERIERFKQEVKTWEERTKSIKECIEEFVEIERFGWIPGNKQVDGFVRIEGPERLPGHFE